jgi:hypothetical protein
LENTLLKLVPTAKSKIAKASSTPIFPSTKVVKSSAMSIPSSLNIFLSFSLVSEDIKGIPNLRKAKKKTSVQGGGKKRARYEDKKGNIYEWDYRHGTLEKYNKGGKHLGEYDRNVNTLVFKYLFKFFFGKFAFYFSNLISYFYSSSCYFDNRILSLALINPCIILIVAVNKVLISLYFCWCVA